MAQTHLGTPSLPGHPAASVRHMQKKLAQRGYDLILIARSGEQLNALASSARLLYWLSVSRCSMS